MTGSVCALLLCALAQPCAAQAISFEIAPTTLDLRSGVAGLLYVTNNGATSAVLQVQTMDWSQNGAADVLTPSATLYASPPLLIIAPGQRQVVRVLADDNDAGRETPHRLLVSELPQGAHRAATIGVLLQFSIPVFVAGRDRHIAASWSAARAGSDLAVTLHNDGDTTLKLGDTILSAPGLPATPLLRSFAYVLPGAVRTWRVPTIAGGHVHLAARDERSGVGLDADISVSR